MGERRIRKKYFIDKNFQSKFILKFCAVVLVSSIVIAGLILLLTQDSTTVAIYNTKVHVQQTADFIKPVVVSVILAVTVLASVGIILMTLFISHSFAGPMFRLKREVDTLAEGSFKISFFLRAKDQLKDLSKSLTKLTDVLKRNQKKQLLQVTELKNYLEDVDYNLLKKDKEVVSGMINQLEQEIRYFKK